MKNVSGWKLEGLGAFEVEEELLGAGDGLAGLGGGGEGPGLEDGLDGFVDAVAEALVDVGVDYFAGFVDDDVDDDIAAGAVGKEREVGGGGRVEVGHGEGDVGVAGGVAAAAGRGWLGLLEG